MKKGALITFQVTCRAYIEPEYVDEFLNIGLESNRIKYILEDEEIWGLMDQGEILSIEYE